MTMISAPDSPLEDGARATTPDGDNVLLDFARTEAAHCAAIARANRGRTDVVPELGLHLADSGSRCPFGNLAHLTRPLVRDETDSLVAELRNFFGEGSGGPYLVFSPWPTADLAPHGFALAGHPPFMLRPAGPSAVAVAVSGVDVSEATTPDQLREFEQTLVEAYPARELSPFGAQPRLFHDQLLGTATRFFVAYDGDRPVATAAAFVGPRVVAVEFVSTRSEHRGRGVGAAITAAATGAAPSLPSALVSSDLGRRVYEGLGYLPVLRYTLWIGSR